LKDAAGGANIARSEPARRGRQGHRQIDEQSKGGFGVGHSVARKEDDRYLRGRGEFIADIKLPGTLELAFVRSPLAHARIRAINPQAGSSGRVFAAADLVGVRPILAVSALPGFKVSGPPRNWGCWGEFDIFAPVLGTG
jgi:aerobic carbon-monoxide dehydrogenase large subunit